jgi:CheY-like chemotaxis protein
MDATAKLLEAVSTLLWPLIVVAVIMTFRPAVAAIIESAKSRKFTLKIGGQELSMEEASEQQRDLIADLQSQVADLRKHLQAPIKATRDAHVLDASVSQHPGSSVLWIDDHPKNNSYFVEQLQKLGVAVDLAMSTAEGLEKLARRRYSVVISDMGRHEDGHSKPTAGLELLKCIRERDDSLPVVFFCSAHAVRKYRDEALRLGASGISSSATELFGLLHLDELKKDVQL